MSHGGMLLGGNTAADELQSASTERAADFALSSAQGADAFSPAELDAARRTGQLPDWYWRGLTTSIAPKHPA